MTSAELTSLFRAAPWRVYRRWPPIRTRTQLLNYLIVTRGYRRYLEIGVRDPKGNFNCVRARLKHGVDPNPLGPVTWELSSDEFFAQTAADTRYDLIFLDGLHLEGQVLRDIENSLGHLAEGGAIVVHDCNPVAEEHQGTEYDGESIWNGTVWKAWARLRATRGDLSMQVVNIDQGCGVITRGRQECYPRLREPLHYDQLAGNRGELLNLREVEEFQRLDA